MRGVAELWLEDLWGSNEFLIWGRGGARKRERLGVREKEPRGSKPSKEDKKRNARYRRK